MAEVVFSGVADDVDLQGSLFQGIKFWLSQRVPQRSRFINDIKVRALQQQDYRARIANSLMGQWRRNSPH